MHKEDEKKPSLNVCQDSSRGDSDSSEGDDVGASYKKQIEARKKQLKLFDFETEEEHGKSLESLLHSRKLRENIMSLFDYDLPMSIMKAVIKPRENEPAAKSYRSCDWVFQNPEKAMKLASTVAKSFAVSGQSVRMGRLSQFPQNIGRMVVRLYTKAGDVVVDPFAGHNSRMELTVAEGRHYHGYDISHEFMIYNFELAKYLREDYKMKIDLFEQDSRHMIHTEDNFGDFTLTSPPYYDLEFYGDEAEQLSKMKTYDDFLRDITLIVKENYRVLKNKAYCIWFINDFRRKGVYHSYHVDMINIFKKVGFVQQDILIVDLGYPIKAAFATQIIEQKILPKRHEYGIIFQKL